ncbi:hypothetical protein ACWELQ_12490, partial [Nocardia sp. NPDC004722]
MHLSRKTAAGMVVSAAAALLTGSMGTAHAAYDRYGSYAVADMGDHWRIGYSLNRPDQAHYEDSGGEGPVVLLGHEFLMDRTMFASQQAA